MFGYGQIKGIPTFVAGWKKDTANMYPEDFRAQALQNSSDPLPVVGGITTGLYVVGKVMLDPGDVLIAPDARWENVDNVFAANLGVTIHDFPFYDEHGGFNLPALKRAIQVARETEKKVAVYINFPNNPTGYMVNQTETEALAQLLESQTEDLIIILDDAYEGYVYYDGGNARSQPIDSSIFPYISNQKDHVMIFKVDAPTKRRPMYGQRLGVVSFGPVQTSMKGINLALLLAKTARSTFSSAPRPPQEALGKIFSNEKKYQSMLAEIGNIKALLNQRHHMMLQKELSMPKLQSLKPMPANSSFFHLYQIKGMDAQQFGYKLLENGLGTVPITNQSGLNGIRLAHCGIPTNRIDNALQILWDSAKEFLG